ncbi:hypothetical protein [Legionella hackeliae]|nr:hypothetical protein [Legionella hackeliae]KTD10575.1 hypothetical protein Lhac_2943 [Legionella hackeliae]STX46804.1 Uncharacterised protein [Legionella hackeliae]
MLKQTCGHSRNQDGLVLLVTIMMLSLLSILVLSAIKTTFLYYQSLNRSVEKKEDFHNLEFYGQQLLKKLWTDNDNCVVDQQDENTIISLLSARGCTLNEDKHRYFYLVEKLDSFACLKTIHGKKTYSTKHWRINILSKTTRTALLQLRFARAIPQMVCPTGKINYIHLGLLSWRYLIDS